MADIMDHPLVSISIINLNGKNYLKDCLESLGELNYPGDKIEILVVDNGSTDDSVKFIRDRFPQVKIIQNSKNNGFAEANNQVAEQAKGKYIAFLNNDTRVDKNWIIELLKPIYKNREVVASSSKVLSFEEMARLDLYYIQNWSIEMDIKILLKIIPTVLFGKGAY